jgi:two-component system sensor histidine kinase YesM
LEDLKGQLDYNSKTNDVTLVVLDKDRKPTSAFDLISKNGIDLSGDFNSYYISGSRNRYLVLGNTSKQGEFSLAALIPEKAILENLPFVQALIYLILAFSLVSLALSIIYLRRIVIYPLNKLIKTMKAIREGNIDTRVPPIRTTDEFHMVNDTFNNMMDQIKQLKINIYEDQVLQQKEELRRLQLEINPHFFLNSLNVVYSLAENRDYVLIKEMTLCLVKYFRFIFYSNRNQITLKEELEHVQNYIRIQELRYPESFQYVIDAPEILYDCLVPPLILQTFVENTNKYAFTLDEFIILTIQVSQEMLDDKPMLKIIIKNTGNHIDENILNQINAGEKIMDKSGNVHTGIWNLQNRLRLLYAGSSSIKVENVQPKGVSTEVIIPVRQKEEES